MARLDKFRRGQGVKRSAVSLLSLLLAIAVAFAAFEASAARKKKPRPKIRTSAPYAILMDASSGTVLYSKNANKLMAPASMSKLMTALMVFEAIKAGDLGLDDEFQISVDAWRRGGTKSGSSTMYAKVKSNIKLNDLLQGLIVQSGNDAAIALAEGMSGTEKAFAKDMTARARELGLKKAVFKNATGLPNPGHRMTVHELALVARHLIYNLSEFYHYFSQKDFTWNNIKQRNRNPLLRQNIGADGLKTGYTAISGYGMVASAKRKGQRLILVINGLKSSGQRLREARKLLAWGFRAFKPYTVFKAGELVGHASVWNGASTYVNLVTKEPISVILTRAQRKNIKAEIVYNGPIQAPIKKGKKIAKLRLTTRHGPRHELPLYAGEDIKRGSLLARGYGAMLFLIFGG